MQTRRNIWLWALYDFANSFVSIIFFLYFAQWVIVEQKVPDIQFNITFSVAALLLLITVPITGVLLDKYYRRISGLRLTTALSVLSYGLCAMATLGGNTKWALIFFTIALYVYLLTFTFYTPLLNDIASPEKRGKVSGLGIAANYAGQILALISVLPFSNGIWSLFGASARAETLLPAVIAFGILSLPMLFFFKEPRRPRPPLNIRKEARHLLHESKELFKYSGVGLFMLAYFLFNDAILTASNNFPVFLEQVWGISDTIKTYLLLGILITSGIGGIVAGYIADRYGHKRTLFVILAGWIVLLPIVGTVTNFTVFVVAVVLMGFWFGASWSVSRSVMSYLAPEGKHNLAFAYFGLVERASSFVGPIVWGTVVSTMLASGPGRYRYAILSVTIFIVLGLIAHSKVRSDRA